MREAELAIIKELLPDWAQQMAFIAGGAAIAPHTADDVDVWVIGPPYVETSLTEIARLQWAKKYPRAAQLRIYDDLSSIGLVAEEAGLYSAVSHKNIDESGIRLIGTVQVLKTDKPIQILTATKTENIVTLLNVFDITAHQWARPIAPGWHRRSVDATLPSELPRVTRFNTPAVTTKRLRKILDRYGWDFTSHPDYPRLTIEAGKLGAEENAAFLAAMLYNPTHQTTSPF